MNGWIDGNEIVGGPATFGGPKNCWASDGLDGNEERKFAWGRCCSYSRGFATKSASAGNAREWMEGEKVQTSDNRGGGDCLLRDQSSIEEKGPKKPFNGLPP